MLIINNLLADILIYQIFLRQMLETSQFAKLSLHTGTVTAHMIIVLFLNSHQAMSVSRDGHMMAWDIEKGEMTKSCEWQRDNKSKWRMRACW